MNPAKPREPCPAEEMRNHGLRLIVGCVRHRDSFAYSGFRQRTKIVIARAPRGVLEIGPLLFRLLGYIDRNVVKLQPMLRGESCNELLVRVGSVAAQLVIKVHHAQHDPQFLAQLEEKQQQSNGICTAGYRHAHSVARPQHFLFLQVSKEALRKKSKTTLALGRSFPCVSHYSPNQAEVVGHESRFWRILPRPKQVTTPVDACGYR